MMMDLVENQSEEYHVMSQLPCCDSRLLFQRHCAGMFFRQFLVGSKPGRCVASL